MSKPTEETEVAAAPNSRTTTTDSSTTATSTMSTSDDGSKEGAEAAATTTTGPENNLAGGGPVPLHGKWTLWFDNPRLAPAGSDWKDCLNPCGNIDSIESFWRLYNNVKPASQLPNNSNYSLFRRGIEPSWEDPSNVDGGKFVLTIGKKDSKIGKCDEWWLYTVLALLGETMDATGDQVNGAVVSIRKSQDKIALWLKTSEKDLCVSIGERWKKALNLEKVAIRYQTHKDAAASGRSFRNEVQFEV